MNIALIEKGRPVLGVVYAPVWQALYIGEVQGMERRAARAEQCARTTAAMAIASAQSLAMSALLSTPRNHPIRVVVSRSHDSKATTTFVGALEGRFGLPRRVQSGSSLKLCMVAEGEADIYPRLAPTMEWDTAAAQAVVEAAGGCVVEYDSDIPASKHLDERGALSLRILQYNKENLLNPFVVCAR